MTDEEYETVLGHLEKRWFHTKCAACLAVPKKYHVARQDLSLNGFRFAVVSCDACGHARLLLLLAPEN